MLRSKILQPDVNDDIINKNKNNFNGLSTLFYFVMGVLVFICIIMLIQTALKENKVISVPIKKPGFVKSKIVSIQGRNEGKLKYCTNNTNGINCNNTSDKKTDLEKFILYYNNDNIVFMEGNTLNKYCGSEGNKIICNKSVITPSELFIVENLEDDLVTIKSVVNKLYCRDDGTNIICDRKDITDLTKFKLSTF